MLALIGAPTGAWADTIEQLDLKCAGAIFAGQNGAPARATIAFEVTVPFGDGDFLALANPETGKPEKLLRDMEVLSGSFRIEREAPQTIVWTRTAGRSGSLTGQVIGSDGEIFSLTIAGAPAGFMERPFVLFSSAAGALTRGSCV
jgi:hypothetical protein